MADLKVNVGDRSGTADSTGAPEQPVERKAYKVIAKNGLLKNGTVIKAGKKVELDEETAARFIEAGDVEKL